MIDVVFSDKEQLRRVIDKSLKSHQKRQLDDEEGTPAGVLIPLFMKEGTAHVLLTLRTNDVASHKGQISFPGGGWEDGDKTTLDTALRETQEEVGIRPADVEVIGELDDVMAVSSHRVTPYVGFIPHPYPLAVNTHEIAEVIEIPPSILRQPRESALGRARTPRQICQSVLL